MSATQREGHEMIPKSVVLAALLAAGLAPACGVAAAQQPALDTLRLAPVAASAEPALDAGFLRAVHQADLAEIAAGGIARERGVSARVRALGARFVRDHTAIDARLTATARAAGVLLPDTPDAAQLALAKKYQSAPAARFDKLYLRTQLTAHEQAMRAGETELAQGADARVKRLVAYAAPIVKAHHDALTAALGYGESARRSGSVVHIA